MALLVREQRARVGLSQAALAQRAAVSRSWLSDLEGGKATAELGLVLRVVAALALELRVDAPAAPGRDAVDLDALLRDFHP